MGSVGEITAGSANATGDGIAGLSQWMNHAAPITVKTTRPSAGPKITRASCRTFSREMRAVQSDKANDFNLLVSI
jgi:hypothetical protein